MYVCVQRLAAYSFNQTKHSSHIVNMKYSGALVATLAFTAVALPLVERQSAAASLADITKGASDFAPKFLAGDRKGAATALGQMFGGAASVAPNVFSDLAKAAGLKEKREVQMSSVAASLADITKGASDFPPKFLAGDQKGAAAALAQMFGGVASVAPGVFSDLAKPLAM
jgi:hypothetical protein